LKLVRGFWLRLTTESCFFGVQFFSCLAARGREWQSGKQSPVFSL
jgi:hypothetical protein